jgi:glyceraldehyde-3-phosphate dehydrogenase (NADP+)
MRLQGNLIGGKWRESEKRYALRAPYSGEALAEICVAAQSEIDEAIANAESAVKKMRGRARFQTADSLAKIAQGIAARKDEFTRTIAREAAKPVMFARAEAERAIQTFSWASEEAKRFAGEVVPVDTQPAGKGKTAWTEFIPRGVIFGVTPFNFPLNLVAHKVAPALASGNAIIVKPSPRTPLTAALLGEVFLASGLPDSALQILQMDVADIDVCLQDERVGMVSFTGSAEVGWQLKTRAGRKKVALELGGNAPVIIDETCDWRGTIAPSVTAAFAYAGQICISAQRFIAQASIAEEWTAEFVAAAAKIRTGDPLEDGALMSVMIDEAAARRAESWVSDAVTNGANLLCGGKREGAMLAPTVLNNCSSETRVVSEEIFAPVAVVSQFDDFDEAITQANFGKYGLQAGVFTNDLARAKKAARELEFGGVLINEMPVFRVDNMPYGGVKHSGFGREGVRYAMEEMCETRLIVWS